MPKSIKLYSWNVNGIRSVSKKGFLEWFQKTKPEILCLQETRISEEQLPEEIRNVSGYYSYWNEAEKKGYNGVCVYTKEKPLSVTRGIGIPRFDREGRVLQVKYKSFTLFNVYFPNGKMSEERLKFKMSFYRAFQKHVKELRDRGEKVVVCGDVNTAHTEIDLARPKQNGDVSGFLPEERRWIDRFLADGFLDTFRLVNSDPDHYSWWSFRSGARERNVGWRIDYFFISENLKRAFEDAALHPDVMGSDHCPASLILNI